MEKFDLQKIQKSVPEVFEAESVKQKKLVKDHAEEF
jgi:hypothetical protein